MLVVSKDANIEVADVDRLRARIEIIAKTEGDLEAVVAKKRG
jgi:hypothetical protein